MFVVLTLFVCLFPQGAHTHFDPRNGGPPEDRHCHACLACAALYHPHISMTHPHRSSADRHQSIIRGNLQGGKTWSDNFGWRVVGVQLWWIPLWAPILCTPPVIPFPHLLLSRVSSMRGSRTYFCMQQNIVCVCCGKTVLMLSPLDRRSGGGTWHITCQPNVLWTAYG